MQLDIITADKNLFSGEADAITLPGSKGKFQLLNGHAALISSLEKGEIKVEVKGKSAQMFSISGGVVEVLNNKVVVLA